jgi:hypothetical protein
MPARRSLRLFQVAERTVRLIAALGIALGLTNVAVLARAVDELADRAGAPAPTRASRPRAASRTCPVRSGARGAGQGRSMKWRIKCSAVAQVWLPARGGGSGGGGMVSSVSGC